ncbi:MAG: helix-turn-helix domain-containing protein [Clostridia bacterium]|nr:helix-turn-helix domain-containing protein [Clostridia bacterium]
MANRFFQGIIHQLSEVVDRKIGILDEGGNIIACSALSDIGGSYHGFSRVQPDENGVIRYENNTYTAVSGAESVGGYVVFVAGTDEVAVRAARLISVSLGNLKQFFDDKYDKSSFIKNILFDNILPSDVYAKAKDLGFAYEEKRLVLIVCLESRFKTTLPDMLTRALGEKVRFYLVNINESSSAVVIELGDSSPSVLKIAQQVADEIQQTTASACCVGVGTIAPNLRELARTYKEAQLSLDVGNVFDKGASVMSYDNLGIGRLIYQMPTTLCEMFLTEVFKQGSIDCLDEETLTTIEKFFENNLNVSETARKLFVHRNTLVYRLEKIKKLTGLDIRDFDNAIVFKVALMVNSYLSANQNKF